MKGGPWQWTSKHLLANIQSESGVCSWNTYISGETDSNDDGYNYQQYEKTQCNPELLLQKKGERKRNHITFFQNCDLYLGGKITSTDWSFKIKVLYLTCFVLGDHSFSCVSHSLLNIVCRVENVVLDAVYHLPLKATHNQDRFWWACPAVASLLTGQVHVFGVKLYVLFNLTLFSHFPKTGTCHLATLLLIILSVLMFCAFPGVIIICCMFGLCR